MAGRGRPTGSRDKLRNNFIVALSDDFAEHGRGAIERMRNEDPSGYVRAIASLMPKEMDVSHKVSPLEHLTDEQLGEIVDATERFLSERAGEEAASVASVEKPAGELPPLH